MGDSWKAGNSTAADSSRQLVSAKPGFLLRLYPLVGLASCWQHRGYFQTATGATREALRLQLPAVKVPPCTGKHWQQPGPHLHTCIL